MSDTNPRFIPLSPDCTCPNPFTDTDVMCPACTAQWVTEIDHTMNGVLALLNGDSYCQRCKDTGQGEGQAAIDCAPEGTWAVVNLDPPGANYHLDCAAALGWQPSQLERQRLERWPYGPYA